MIGSIIPEFQFMAFAVNINDGPRKEMLCQLQQVLSINITEKVVSPTQHTTNEMECFSLIVGVSHRYLY